MRFLARLIARWQAWRRPFVVSSVDPDLLDKLHVVHSARFAHADFDRLVRLWIEIAEVCEVPPDQLSTADEIERICPTTKWLGLSENPRLEHLGVLIGRESRHLAPPSSAFITVGDVLEYLLQ